MHRSTFPSAETIAATSERIARKEVSPVELAQSCFDRAERLEPSHNAFVRLCRDRALQLARAAEARATVGARLGPLDGIPMSIKDMVQVAGVPTSNGSGAGWQLPAGGSARVIENLERAGAIILGKTNLHELGVGITNDNPHFGPTRNPWAPDRSPGGSSGGSAVAVAMGVGLGTVGTDTGGSIRIPAAACGIFGLKPSYGLLSTEGVTGISWTLDHVGPLAASAEDLGLVFAGMRDVWRDPPSPDGFRLRGWRVGIPISYFNERIEPAVRAAYEAALQALQAEGAQVIEVALPPMDQVVPDAFTFSKVEASYLHRERFAAHPQNIGADTRAFLQASQSVPALAYVEAQKRRDMFCAGVEALFDTVDALVVPTLPASPKPFGTDSVVIDGAPEPLFDCMIRYTSVFNVSGHPALAAPCPIEADGAPAGIQFVGPFGSEDRLFRVVGAYAKAALGQHMSRLATLRQRAG